jgi:hypothetical protein
MTYISVLPEVFPYVALVDEPAVIRIAWLLNQGRKGAPNGSSFAVTSDASSGKRRVWLSEVSFQTIINEMDSVRYDITPTRDELGDTRRPRVEDMRQHEYERSEFATADELAKGTAACAQCGNIYGATIHRR